MAVATHKFILGLLDEAVQQGQFIRGRDDKDKKGEIKRRLDPDDLLRALREENYNIVKPDYLVGGDEAQ